MNIIYGYKWFRNKKKLTEEWDDKRAKKRHDKRQLYAAVLTLNSTPIGYIELNNDYIGVGFLDVSLREYMSYIFSEVEPGRYFLSQVTHREYGDSTDDVERGTVYYFRQDGHVKIEKHDYRTNDHSVCESQVEVSDHWEPYPEFGQYETLLEKERGKTMRTC